MMPSYNGLDHEEAAPPAGALLSGQLDGVSEREAETLLVALRESEAKYRALFTSINIGYCIIEVVFDAADQPADYVFLEANPAFLNQTGLADAMGRRMRDLAPDHEAFWFETYGRIARTGVAERFEHRADALDRWYSVEAFRIGDPGAHRVAVLFEDIKARKQREIAAALLDEVSKDLARLSSPSEIMQAVGGRLGAALGLSACLFVDVEEPVGEVSVHYAWPMGAEPDLRRTYRLGDYLTDDFADASRAGTSFVVRDTTTDPRTDAANHAGLGIGAFVVSPFLSAGRWTGYLAAATAMPRDWRAEEVELLREVSDRLFARIERARAEVALRESEARQRVLVGELQHRVRNVLTVIRSVFGRTVETSDDLDTVADHFRGRLDALARTQVVVTRSATGVADLEELIRDELLSVGVQDGPSLKIHGPDVELPSRSAEAIGLAIHELTTNALKYGALRSPGGSLDVSWTVNMEQGGVRRLHIVWVEQGVPAVPLEPVREGFGRELIEQALPYRLGAQTRLEFRGGGVRCFISLRLPEEEATRG